MARLMRDWCLLTDAEEKMGSDYSSQDAASIQSSDPSILKKAVHTHTHLEFITYRCQQNTKSTIEIVQEKPSVEPKACPRAEAGHGPESWRYDG